MKKAKNNGGSGPLRVEEMMPKKLSLWNTRTFRPIITHDELEPILTSLGFIPLPPSSSPPLPPPAPPQTTAAQESGEKAPPDDDPSATSKAKAKTMMWREYAYTRSSSSAAEGGAVWVSQAELLPRPRLPYPRVDGLHLMTYKAFLGALEFFLGPTAVPNLFHVRTISLTQALDLVFDKSYRPMRDCGVDDEGILVYRDGTLDHITTMVCNLCSNDSNDKDNNFNNIITSSCIKRACNNMNENPSNSSYLVPLKDLFPSRNILSPS